ncbi:winged helix-turn-helix domain-containing protein [Methylocystis sp. WRRC1]|uniref:helix-turn-helix domain-containing protein n=1 Tax=Methylocystis sp. WRRC1 TaxID=1732014 RepID=UPI001D141D2A|nr:winged helix-turn-helix domain-containing protein [Methylocystis sp. WRRC1]MCC3245041.1 winged helix-turn-helix domain-containing protein [Methylocystis sp. WRRC1]
MASAVRLRGDFDADRLRALARGAKDGPQARRRLALAAIYGGTPRSKAVRIGGATLQIVRDWVLRFNAHGPNGLLDRKAPGPASLMQDAHRTALARIVEEGPIAAVHGVVRWWIVDLCQWLFDAFRLSVSETTMSRELRKMGYRKLSARPRHHAQQDGEIEVFKKISPRGWRRSAAKKASTPTA